MQQQDENFRHDSHIFGPWHRTGRSAPREVRRKVSSVTRARSLLLCDCCDPRYVEVNYYRNGFGRAPLPRLFYGLIILQICTVFAAFSAYPAALCAIVPGGAKHIKTVRKRVQSGNATVALAGPLHSSNKEHHVRNTKTQSAKVLQARRRKLLRFSRRRSSSSVRSSRSFTPPLREAMSLAPAVPRQQQRVGLYSQVAKLQGKIEDYWQSVEEAVEERIIGHVNGDMSKIDCDKCSQSSTRGDYLNFESGVDILCTFSVIVTLLGASAMANYVLLGPQRLLCYIVLALLIAACAFDISVHENVRSVEIEKHLLPTVSSKDPHCRAIVSNMARASHMADIFWALHAVCNVFSASLGILGVLGCHRLEDTYWEKERGNFEF